MRGFGRTYRGGADSERLPTRLHPNRDRSERGAATDWSVLSPAAASPARRMRGPPPGAAAAGYFWKQTCVNSHL